MTDLRTDRSLVRSAQAGAGDAAAALIERYYPKVRAFVSYLIGGSGNADDLTQEVFARALAALPRFNGNYRFGPWVFRIAKNLCIDESRRNNFRPEPADPAVLPFMESRPADADYVWESISSQMASSIVRRALKRLPWRQRTALILKELEGMSYNEISQVIGSGVRGVEATLRRARSNFRLAVARVEETDVQKASCIRTLKLVAGDSATSTQTRKHLRTCPDCRSRASSIVAADKLLGMLPPLAFGLPAWKSEVVARLSSRSSPQPRQRGLLETLRGHPSIGLVSPLAQVAQYAACMAVAASVSVASVTSVAKIGFVSGAPTISDQVAAQGPEPSAAVRIVQPAPLQSEAANQTDSGSASVLDGAEAIKGLDSTLAQLAENPTLNRLSGTVDHLADAVSVLSAAAALEGVPGPADSPVQGSELPDPTGAAVTPAPVSLPRRRPHSA